jgi:hypothetical protein
MGRFHRPFGNFIGHNLENQNGRRSILILKEFKIIIWSYMYMILPYFAGLCLGMCLGQANKQAYRSYYYSHTEKIRQLENKLTKYERLFGKID